MVWNFQNADYSWKNKCVVLFNITFGTLFSKNLGTFWRKPHHINLSGSKDMACWRIKPTTFLAQPVYRVLTSWRKFVSRQQEICRSMLAAELTYAYVWRERIAAIYGRRPYRETAAISFRLVVVWRTDMTDVVDSSVLFKAPWYVNVRKWATAAN